MGIVFLTRYPNRQDLQDGYFQRVFSVNSIFDSFEKWYIHYNSKNIFPYIKKMEDNLFEVQVSKYSPIGWLYISFLVLNKGAIYLHSILRLQSKFHQFLFWVARKRILDVHGSVPEEFAMHGDLNGQKIFDRVERFAIKNATTIIVVTEAMQKHLIKKHEAKENRFVRLPIYASGGDLNEKTKKFEKSVIYCGGLQKWQQVEKMLEYVWKNKGGIKFTFLVPDPETLQKKYQKKYGENFPGVVMSADADEVKRQYARHCFGLVLREDSVVNRVACPTKLTEYLQNDIVPIVDFEGIGDFKEYNYRYIRYSDELPSEEEWHKMVEDNRIVMKKLTEKFVKGTEYLRKVL